MKIDLNIILPSMSGSSSMTSTHMKYRPNYCKMRMPYVLSLMLVFVSNFLQSLSLPYLFPNPLAARFLTCLTFIHTHTHTYIQGDQKVSLHLKITVHTIGDLKMTITEYIQNVDRPMLNTVFENTVRRVNKCLETGGGHFEHYL